MIKRIHVRYHLRVDDGADMDVITRVHGFHADRCPVARSIRDSIAVTTELVTEPG